MGEKQWTDHCAFYFLCSSSFNNTRSKQAGDRNTNRMKNSPHVHSFILKWYDLKLNYEMDKHIYRGVSLRCRWRKERHPIKIYKLIIPWIINKFLGVTEPELYSHPMKRKPQSVHKNQGRVGESSNLKNAKVTATNNLIQSLFIQISFQAN